MAGNKDLFTNTTHEGLSQGENSRWLQLSYPLGPCGLHPNGLSLPINHYNSEAAYLLGSAKSSHPPTTTPDYVLELELIREAIRLFSEGGFLSVNQGEYLIRKMKKRRRKRNLRAGVHENLYRER